ncbi:hypothetical protein GCM10022386_01590 [Flavobacterium cheonhonense]|uniref:Secretion system C-terminal sorting domain-containing protein n=3 Tax=Flavobacterium cheonhonense TaxID=706185 RepID=A0ABP7T7V1_9FLAO
MMKKYFLLIILLNSFTILGQNELIFFKSNHSVPKLSEIFKSYEILTISDNITNLGNGQELKINFNQEYKFILKENKLVTEDHLVAIKSEDKIDYKSLEELNFDGKYFFNQNANAQSQLAISFFDNQYTIYVKSNGNEFYIEPLNKYVHDAAKNSYVYYEVKNIKNYSDPLCDITMDEKNGYSNKVFEEALPNNDCKVVRLNYCIDYSLYAAMGSINATINKTFETLNLTQLDYSVANSLAFDVNFKVLRHYIITCNNCNYWPTTDSLTINSSYFRVFEYYSLIFSTGNANINVFCQNYVSSSGVLGLGTVNAFQNCVLGNLTTIGSALMRVFPSAGTNRSILSHEFGHNFGCQHIDGANVMNPGGSTSNYWEPVHVALINSKLQNATCFANCQTELCYNDNIENLVISINNTTKNVNVNWLSENDKIYKIRVYNYNNNSWSSFTNISYPQSNFSFQYNNNATVCSKRYKVEITPVCSGVDGFSNTIVFEVPDIQNPSLTFFSTTQDQALCSGLSYTFTVNAIYPGTSPTYQWKINNNNVGSNSPEFTTSVLQNGDVLSCQIISNEPCMLSQTAVISKTVTVTPQPCSLANEEHNIQLMELYPNPVKEIFTLKSNEVINRVCIYNILGQKILEIPASKTELIIDIANFSNATYFVKIYTESSAKTIKVIKE